MADTRTDELYRALQDKGYPDELCREIAYKHMNTDYTATRMLGYLYRVTSPRVEDVIDEMLAILSDREAIEEREPPTGGGETNFPGKFFFKEKRGWVGTTSPPQKISFKNKTK